MIAAVPKENGEAVKQNLYNTLHVKSVFKETTSNRNACHKKRHLCLLVQNIYFTVIPSD